MGGKRDSGQKSDHQQSGRRCKTNLGAGRSKNGKKCSKRTGLKEVEEGAKLAQTKGEEEKKKGVGKRLLQESPRGARA